MVRVYKLHVVSPQHFAQDDTHLHERQTVDFVSIPALDQKRKLDEKNARTYLLPKQTRVPSRKGWLACFLSVHSGSIQRSGKKSNGRWKFSSECVAAHDEVDTCVYAGFSLLLASFIAH